MSPNPKLRRIATHSPGGGHFGKQFQSQQSFRLQLPDPLSVYVPHGVVVIGIQKLLDIPTGSRPKVAWVKGGPPRRKYEATNVALIVLQGSVSVLAGDGSGHGCFVLDALC
jgi:hypothetical protein